MKLSIIDRLALLSVLPKQGDFLTLQVAKRLLDRVNFSAKEKTDFALQQTSDGRVGWDETKATNAEFEFSDDEHTMIVAELRRRNDERTLGMDHFGIYRAFVLSDVAGLEHAPIPPTSIRNIRRRNTRKGA